jgi:hypothetical protein
MNEDQPTPDPDKAREHEAARASLERKLGLVRDHVTAVARGYSSGYYLCGSGGQSKSYTVLRHLETLDVPHQLFNSRMSAKGLFLALNKAPDAIFVLEDMERLTKDRDAQGVLRSALWAQPGHDRIVSWTTERDGAMRFTFRGGLILIANRPLADLPELRALASRIEVHRLEISDAELAALMRELASQGYHLTDRVGIGPEECLQVTEYLLRECHKAGCRLDLRLQQKAFRSYLQYAADLSVNHWEDLIAADVREATCHFRYEQNTMSQEAKRARRRNVIREIIGKGATAEEQVRIYTEKTQASRPDFYRRKLEVEGGEFDEHDQAYRD